MYGRGTNLSTMRVTVLTKQNSEPVSYKFDVASTEQLTNALDRCVSMYNFYPLADLNAVNDMKAFDYQEFLKKDDKRITANIAGVGYEIVGEEKAEDPKTEGEEPNIVTKGKKTKKVEEPLTVVDADNGLPSAPVDGDETKNEGSTEDPKTEGEETVNQ